MASARLLDLTPYWRSGDLLDLLTFRQVRTMRSSEKVAHDFRFTCLRTITERDLKHPCTKALQTAQDPHEVLVQPKSKIEDACALMYAKHLAVGTMTMFRKTVSTRTREFSMI